ncbi:MAG: hypothetical protein P1S60_18330, partial [Anaerolineae bacterium]|nr:hypothetical protein [Anaerolineae bacterium]
ADGYDGGLLPIAPYISFTRLFLENGTQDGRLRENLVSVPDKHWLRLLDVRYVMTDKTSDRWVDDILYDMQFTTVISHGEVISLAWLPEMYKADGMGIIYNGLDGYITVTFQNGKVERYQLPEMEQVLPHRIVWEENSPVVSIDLSTVSRPVTYSAISLINTETASFYPLTLSDTYRLVHSGDVKIYEDTIPAQRASFVPGCQIVDSEIQARQLLVGNPSMVYEAVLLDPLAAETCRQYGQERMDLDGQPAPSVIITDYQDLSVTLQGNSPVSGFILLSDAWYPGWEALLIPTAGGELGTVRGVPVLRANLMFRAVPVPAGEWALEIKYHPRYLWLGSVISVVSVMLFAFYIYYWKRKKWY